jgi:tetratricopeptide (TPR) repeat protein
VWLAEAQGKTDAALHWNAESLKTATSDDFEYYWTRSDLLLSVALTSAARAAIDGGRVATKDADNAKVALVRVVYCEGGESALRIYLQAAHLDQSIHANALFEAAYGALLLGDAVAVKRLTAKAMAAPDRAPGYAEDAWYARGIRSEMAPYQLNVAAADLAMGDRASAQRELQRLVSMLDAMIAAGVERHATYQYRAEAHALLGQGDEAMRDLASAVKLGWRRVWWARHEPYFASLYPRGDFRALMDSVERANEPLAAKIAGSGGL